MPFIGGLLAGGGSLLGGLFGANAASSASQAQVRASEEAIKAQLGVASQIQRQLNPWVQGGNLALSGLTNNLPGYGNAALTQTPQQFAGIGPPQSPTGAPALSIPNPSDPATIALFQQSPGYQYELQQSGDAIQNSAAGRTGALSSNMLRALQGNATGLASQDYYNWLNSANQFGTQNFNAANSNFWNTYNANNQNYWNQYNAANTTQQNYINRLLALSQLGQSSAASAAQTGVPLGTNIGQAQVGIGNAIAGGQIGGTQALTSGINNALPYLAQAFGGNAGSGPNDLSYLFGQYGQPFSSPGGAFQFDNSQPQY